MPAKVENYGPGDRKVRGDAGKSTVFAYWPDGRFEASFADHSAARSGLPQAV